jgi:hypothetical protein
VSSRRADLAAIAVTNRPKTNAPVALRTLVALVLVGFITHSTNAGSGDEPHYLAIAHSIAFDGDVDLANNYGSNEPLIAGGGLAPENHVHEGAGGVARPVHDVGLPLLFAPVARVLKPLAGWLSATAPESLMRRAKLTPTVLYRHLISLVMIAIATWMAGVLFQTCLELGASMRAALGTTLIAVLSPPLLVHSTLFFTELPSAAVTLFVFRRTHTSLPASSSGWLLVGVAIGLLVLLHVRNAGLAIALALLAFGAARTQAARPHKALALIGGLALLLLVRTGVNHVFWGTWVTTPHAALGQPAGIAATAREAGIRLAGIAIDQEFGLLPYAPILLLVPIGLATMRDRQIAAGIVFASACYIAPILWPVTNVHGWTGGWSPAARFMVPIVPLLALALPAAFLYIPRMLLAVLVVLQIGIDAYMWQNPKNLWNDGDGVAAVCSRGGFSVCGALPSVTRWRD